VSLKWVKGLGMPGKGVNFVIENGQDFGNVTAKVRKNEA
jgi:hypothetical protein